MKAKEIMSLYNITRPTLSAWKKDGKIQAVKLPNGQFDYKVIEENVATVDLTKDKVNCSVTDKRLDTIIKGFTIIDNFMIWLNKINFMGPEVSEDLEKVIDELKNLSKIR